MDIDLITLAYDFAKTAHQGQKRLSGEDYISHPLATAQTLAELKMDTASIIAGLLHDICEETPYTLEDIDKNFGREVRNLVDGLIKCKKIQYRGLERYMENVRKMFVAMAQDLRVIIIKCADRLNNLKTLSSLPAEKQKRIALESLEIYAPIAHRLGMAELAKQLEDTVFPHLYPEEYQKLVELVKSYYHKQKAIINQTKKILEAEFKKAGLNIISIHGRAKHLWSLYKKLTLNGNDITKIYDLMALRIIVENKSDCYLVLGLIHQLWRPLKGRIKDYIAQPKPNDYQSLHTTVFGEGGNIVEIQIRTLQMHEEAEYGIAAHWHYKEKGVKMVDKKLEWVKELTRWQKELAQNQKYLDSLKLDILKNRIFVFTPKGDVIDLPEDSTPIDFAYHIHTDIGNHCVGALVNDEIAPLNTKLKSGDMVKILVDKNRQYPSEDWLSFIKTRVAYSKIKSALRGKPGYVTRILKLVKLK